MDAGSVLTLVLLALFLAVQPWSVLAGVLLVTAEGGVAKEVAFVLGWVLALLAVAIVTVVLFPQVPKTSSTSKGLATVELVAGVLLGLWLWRRWQRPADPGTAGQPAWMGRLDTMRPVVAFGLGVFLPNYVVVVAAVSEMLQAGLKQGALAFAAAAFVVVASAGVAAPLAVLVFRRERAQEIYQNWRAWIVGHSRVVLFGVGVFVAVILVVKGVVGIF